MTSSPDIPGILDNPPSQIGVTADNAVRSQLRGTALLLAGRGGSLLINLLTQIVIIRVLSKDDFGVLSTVIGLVEIASVCTTLCLDKLLARYGALYHEQNDGPRFWGIILTSLTLPLIAGISVVAALFFWQQSLISVLGLQPDSMYLLLILAALVPLNGLAAVSQSLFSLSSQGAQTIMIRRHFVGPCIKFFTVCLMLLLGGQVAQVTIALMISGIFALAGDSYLVFKTLRSSEFSRMGSYVTARLELREWISYTGFLATADAAFIARGSLAVVLLDWLTRDSSAVGAFRAALPIVKLNEVIILNFAMMFVPLAVRLVARNESAQLGELYRQSTTWVSVLGFPVVAGCLAMSEVICQSLFGPEYRDSASILRVLAMGYFLQSAFGISTHLLKALGHVTLLAAIDLLTAIATIVATLIIVPHYGKEGAAAAITFGMLMHTSLKAFAVHQITNVRTPTTAESQSRSAVWLACAVLSVWTALGNPGLIGGAFLWISTSAAVLVLSRSALKADEMFPELSKARKILRWLGKTDASTTNFPSLATNGKPSEGGTNPTTSGPRLAYMMSRFPKLTETFVLFEIREMERAGVSVEIYPLQREKAKVMHDDAATYVARAKFTPFLSLSFLSDHFHFLKHAPVRYFSTLSTLIIANLGSLRYLFGVLAFFPKAVHLARRMQQDRIDHLHAHFASHPAAVAWIIHRFTGIPYSFTAHGSDLHRDQHMLKEKTLDSAAVIAISKYNREVILNVCGRELAERVHVVHCGVDLVDFSFREQKTPFDQEHSPFQIACVGTLHEVKGQSFLLKACHRLREQGRTVICHLLGDGPDRKALEQLATEYNLTECVKFHGHCSRDTVRRILQEVDVLIAPSVVSRDRRREGIPVVLMEAMASGVPAIGSRLSGIPELILHEQTGLLTECKDIEGIAAALERMAASPELRRKLAVAGREYVANEFDQAQCARKLLAIIVGTLDSSPRHRVNSAAASTVSYDLANLNRNTAAPYPTLNLQGVP